MKMAIMGVGYILGCLLGVILSDLTKNINLEKTIKKKHYQHLYENKKEKYRNKALKEMLKSINRDVDRTINKKYTYTVLSPSGNISKTTTNDKYVIYDYGFEDFIGGDFHIEEFLNNMSNKSYKYYEMHETLNKKIDYSWFMNKIENYFKQNDNIKTERGTQTITDDEYGYVLLKFK